MSRFLVLAYGILCYLIFFLAFLYLIGFLANFGVPKGIDDGAVTGSMRALAADLVLIALFGVQHSIMARPWFKSRWTRIVPKAVERSTFVLAASIVLMLVYWFWKPMPQTIWQVDTPWLQSLLWAVFAGGFLIVLLSTFMTDHFDLFGLRQVYLRFIERPYQHPTFKVIYFYRLIRHPLYVGMFIGLWATPHMTQGHLLFAAGMTVYVLIAVGYEERDLVTALGTAYGDYQQRVPKFIPRIGTVHDTVRSSETSPSRMR